MVDHPHSPAFYDLDILHAVQAFMSGKANEGQQATVRDWLLHHVCRVDDMSYRHGDAEATAFAEGKRYVGNSIRKMLNPITLKALEASERRPEQNRKRTIKEAKHG